MNGWKILQLLYSKRKRVYSSTYYILSKKVLSKN